MFKVKREYQQQSFSLTKYPIVNFIISIWDNNTWLVHLPANSKDACWDFLYCNLSALSFWVLKLGLRIQINFPAKNSAIPLCDIHISRRKLAKCSFFWVRGENLIVELVLKIVRALRCQASHLDLLGYFLHHNLILLLELFLNHKTFLLLLNARLLKFKLIFQ